MTKYMRWVLPVIFLLIAYGLPAVAATTEDVVTNSKPAIVRILIEVKPGDNDLLQFYNFKSGRKLQEPVRVKAGTGFIINENGYILTAYHVIYPLGKSPTIYVRLPKEGDQLAEVVATDRERQLACIRIKKFGLPFLPFVQEMPSVGSDVFTMGFPFAADTSELTDQEPTFTEGKVGALKQSRQEATFIQTNAAINLGNAGGPLLSSDGKVLGVIIGSADRSLKKLFEVIFAETDIPVGIGFAAPSKPSIDMLKAAGIDFSLASSGVKQPEQPVQPAQPAAAPPPNPADTKKDKTNLTGIIALVAGMLVLGVVVFFMLSRKGKSPSVKIEPSTTFSPVSPSRNTTISLGALRCSDGEYAGKVFPVTETGLSIGRGEDNDIHLDSEVISRKHAWIGPSGAEMVAKDLGSTNGTYVNGKRIQGSHPLQKGDIISLSKSGQESFLFGE